MARLIKLFNRVIMNEVNFNGMFGARLGFVRKGGYSPFRPELGFELRK